MDMREIKTIRGELPYIHIGFRLWGEEILYSLENIPGGGGDFYFRGNVFSI